VSVCSSVHLCLVFTA